MPATFLAVVCGVVFGLAFGLTGVGSIFAVPLLVYAIGLPPHQAVCVAMVAVTSLSALLTAWRWRGAGIEHRAGIFMSAAGVLGAPSGAWLSRLLSGRWLMVTFAIVTALIAGRMLLGRREPTLPGPQGFAAQGSHTSGLALAGLAAGILAGLLGMGGLLIVPALVLIARIEIHRAIVTSLLVVCAIGVAAISSHLFAGQTIPPFTTSLFVVAGAAGMVGGLWSGNRLAERRLEVVFAFLMLLVALFIIGRAIR